MKTKTTHKKTSSRKTAKRSTTRKGVLKGFTDEHFYKISANKSARTLTIRDYINGKLNTEYRTYRLDPDEFHYYSNHATQGDIRQLLKSSDYYVVK